MVAVWLLVAVWKPAVRPGTFTALWVLSVLATLGAIAARSSGESLAAAVGLPDDHADAGSRLTPAAVAMAITVLVAGDFTLVRPMRVFATGARAMGAIAAIVALPLTSLAGHSGAEVFVSASARPRRRSRGMPRSVRTERRYRSGP